MPDNTPKLSMPYIVASQAQKEVSHNEALNVLDILVQPLCLGLQHDPPPSPAQGDTYIISGGTATGDWLGYETYIAAYYDTWVFIAPGEGWEMRSLGDGNRYYFNGVGWLPTPGGAPGAWQIPSLGGGWVGLGGSYANPRYRVAADGMVTVEGGIQHASTATDGVLFTLLPEYRPTSDLIFGCCSAGGLYRVDVRASGDVEVSAANAVFSSLSGIQFYVD